VGLLVRKVQKETWVSACRVLRVHRANLVRLAPRDPRVLQALLVDPKPKWNEVRKGFKDPPDILETPVCKESLDHLDSRVELVIRDLKERQANRVH